MMSKKRIQGFLFQPCNYSADESDSGDNDGSHDYDEKEDLYRYMRHSIIIQQINVATRLQN